MVEWMVNGVDPYLDANNDMGDDLKTSSDFNDGHQRVLGDLKVHQVDTWHPPHKDTTKVLIKFCPCYEPDLHQSCS